MVEAAKNGGKLPHSAAERVAAVLCERIISGEIAGGTALRQDHIAEEFGSSHVPVREAFHRLQAQGLVVALPRRGVRVTSLDAVSIRETVEMRTALEALALRHAMPHIKQEHIDELEAAQLQCDQAASLVEWDRANREFHRALVAQCRMPRLLATLDILQLTNSRVVFEVGRAQGWQPRSNHDHRLIIDALKTRDTERALILLGRHIGTMERIGFPATMAS